MQAQAALCTLWWNTWPEPASCSEETRRDQQG